MEPGCFGCFVGYMPSHTMATARHQQVAVDPAGEWIYWWATTNANGTGVTTGIVRVPYPAGLTKDPDADHGEEVVPAALPPTFTQEHMCFMADGTLLVAVIGGGDGGSSTDRRRGYAIDPETGATTRLWDRSSASSAVLWMAATDDDYLFAVRNRVIYKVPITIAHDAMSTILHSNAGRWGEAEGVAPITIEATASGSDTIALATDGALWFPLNDAVTLGSLIRASDPTDLQVVITEPPGTSNQWNSIMGLTGGRVAVTADAPPDQFFLGNPDGSYETLTGECPGSAFWTSTNRVWVSNRSRSVLLATPPVGTVDHKPMYRYGGCGGWRVGAAGFG